jgi:3-hydroxyacyl-CoA dehydrogenase
MADKVAMIGSGIIGRAFAICFSRGGYEVALWDPVEGVTETALPTIEGTVRDLEEHDLLNGHSAAAVMSRIQVADSVEAAVEGTIHVQENAPEKLEVKQEMFATLDRVAPADAVLASSSSSIVCSLFTEDLKGRHRCLIVHPTNPPYVVPILELVPAPWTDPAITRKTRERLEAMGQAPITLNKEIAGFIMNRFQAPILQEAFRLVAAGVASPADVDRAMSEGISQRWSFIGPSRSATSTRRAASPTTPRATRESTARCPKASAIWCPGPGRCSTTSWPSAARCCPSTSSRSVPSGATAV